MSSAVPNSPKDSILGKGTEEKDVGGVDTSDDEDEVLETAQNERWQKYNVQV